MIKNGSVVTQDFLVGYRIYSFSLKQYFAVSFLGAIFVLNKQIIRGFPFLNRLVYNVLYSNMGLIGLKEYVSFKPRSAPEIYEKYCITWK